MQTRHLQPRLISSITVNSRVPISHLNLEICQAAPGVCVGLGIATGGSGGVFCAVVGGAIGGKYAGDYGEEKGKEFGEILYRERRR